MLCTSNFKLRWVMITVLALLATATATATCNVTGDSESTSTSASSGVWDEDAGDVGDVPADGGDDVFNPLDVGGNDNGNGYIHQGCTEEALWCPSLAQALSRDPTMNCDFPPCPPQS